MRILLRQLFTVIIRLIMALKNKTALPGEKTRFSKKK